MTTNPHALTRLMRLLRLISELSHTKLDTVTAAELLNCSPSTARVYLMELLDAGVVFSCIEAGGHRRRPLSYSLHKDYQRVQEYLARLSGPRAVSARVVNRRLSHVPMTLVWRKRGDGVD